MDESWRLSVVGSEADAKGRPLHPELAFEVDLARREAPFLEQFNGLFGTLAGGHPSRAEVKLTHSMRVTRRA